MSSKEPTSEGVVEEDGEDDYMNMIITEPTTRKEKETYTQRRRRKELESEARGRVKSKAEKESDEAAARDAALSKSLLTDPAAATNKGFAMMAKMGFKPGVALGSKENTGARTEPIGINIKEDKGGIGLNAEKKRKFREATETEAKRVKAVEGDYRERVRKERDDTKFEGQFQAAMRVAERLNAEEEETQIEGTQISKDATDLDRSKQRRISTKPLKQINVLWRGLVRNREEKERDRRMRYDLNQSLSRLPTYDDPDEEKEEEEAWGKQAFCHNLVEDLEEEDPELDAFNDLDPAERLSKLVIFLRDEYKYCFWCKCMYQNKEMDGCPGVTEEGHD